MIKLRYLISILFFLQVLSARSLNVDSLHAVLEKSSGREKIALLNTVSYRCRFADAQFAMRSGLEGLEMCSKIKADTSRLLLHLNVGLLLYDIGKYDKALEQFIAAEKSADHLGDMRSMASAMQNIGMVYQSQTLYEKALVNYNQALAKFQEAGAADAVASVYTSIGALYYELNEREKALEYFLKALMISEELKDQKGIADGLNNAAVIYEELKNYDKAMEYHKRSLELSRAQSNIRGVSTSLYNLALIYKSKNQYDNAINYIDSAMIAAKSVSAFEMLKEYDKTLSEIYYIKSDYKTSLKYYTDYAAIKDTLVNQDRNKLIVEMSTKYQTEKKDKENQILKQQTELQNLSINRQRIISYSVTVVLLLVIVLAFYIYRGYQQKKRVNLQLEEKNMLIQEKSKIVEEKNKDITDSIRYAKRLQTAILKPEETLGNYFDDGFILFRPKDIVSGDFYWFEKFGNLSLVAAADCTGHGVPGAFMSIIGCNLLSQAVNEYAITQPAAILNSINKGLNKVLQQKGDQLSVTDGMDIALCVYNAEKMTVEYSGAYNPLWIVRDGQLMDFAADKFPVGAFVDKEVRKFGSQEVKVKKGDMLYLFSDGFADQFGGPQGKKFKYKQLQGVLIENSVKPCKEQRSMLVGALESWMGRLEQIDDILVIGIRI
ncbi:MAG: tetratricopeptide repeat protein [Bacteroidia bacterium]